MLDTLNLSKAIPNAKDILNVKAVWPISLIFMNLLYNTPSYTEPLI